MYHREQILPPALEQIRNVLHSHPYILSIIQAEAVQILSQESESGLIQTDGNQQQIEVDHTQVRAQTQAQSNNDIEKAQNQSENIAEVHTQILPQQEVRDVTKVR